MKSTFTSIVLRTANIPAFIVYPFDTLYHSFLIYSKPFRRSMYILFSRASHPAASAVSSAAKFSLLASSAMVISPVSKPYTHKQEIPPAYHGEHLSVSLCIMQFLDFSLAQKSAKRFFSSICKNTVGLRLHKDNKLLAKRVYEPFIFLPYYLKIQCL